MDLYTCAVIVSTTRSESPLTTGKHLAVAKSYGALSVVELVSIPMLSCAVCLHSLSVPSVFVGPASLCLMAPVSKTTFQVSMDSNTRFFQREPARFIRGLLPFSFADACRLTD